MATLKKPEASEKVEYMAKIFVVRHAESVANTKGVYQGQTYDTGLSTLGKKQAGALARRCVSLKIGKIVSSPLKRAIETAFPAAQKCGLEVTVDQNLIETDHGGWSGKDKFWIAKNYPDLMKKWLITPSKVTFPEGEKFSETIDRVGRYIFRTSWKGNTLLVTHDNIIRIIVCFAKNIDIDDMWKIPLDPGGISTFKVEGVNGTKRIKVVKLNDVSHLKDLRADLANHAL